MAFGYQQVYFILIAVVIANRVFESVLNRRSSVGRLSLRRILSARWAYRFAFAFS
jgi:hypothetical protein